MNAEQGTQIVQLLRNEPLFYKNFGPYWWHVKSELRRLGHGADVLPHLGSYQDPSPLVSDTYAGKTPEQIDEEAFATASMNAAVQRNATEHVLDDGDVYALVDEDVGI